MRGKIQFQSETPYVFLGSIRNEMSAMSTNSRSPFCKSAALFDIGRIDDDDFADFLTRRFKTDRRSGASPSREPSLQLTGSSKKKTFPQANASGG